MHEEANIINTAIKAPAPGFKELLLIGLPN